MSIPSITIRLDFGEGGVSGGTVQQGDAPIPIELGSLGVSADSGSVPTPTGNPAAATAEAAPPMPSAGALGEGIGAATGAPPKPSGNIPGLDQGAVGGGGAMPQPEADPSDKKPGRK